MKSFILKNSITIPTEANKLTLVMLALNSIFVFFNPDMFMGIADYFCFLVLFIIFSVLTKKTFALTHEIRYLIVLLFYMFIALAVAGLQGFFSSGYFLSYLIYLLVFILALNQHYSKEDIDFLLDMYILSAVIIAVLIIVQRYDYYGSGSERHTIKILSHDAFDPNFLAAYLVVPAVLVFSRMLRNFKARRLIALLLIVAGTLYTSSRGAAVSMALGMAIVVFGFCKGRKKARRILTIVLILGSGILLAKEFIPGNALIRLLNFKAYTTDGSNSKRFLDWQYGLQAYIRRPLFGYGLMGELTIIKGALNVEYISHNTFIAFLLQFGAVGFLLILAGLADLLWRIRRNATLVACLLSALAVSFFVSAEVSLFFWMPIIYVTVISAYEKQNGCMFDFG